VGQAEVARPRIEFGLFATQPRNLWRRVTGQEEIAGEREDRSLHTQLFGESFAVKYSRGVIPELRRPQRLMG
jgi:hypothetical protein